MSKKVKEMLIGQYGYAPDLIFEVKANRRIFAYKECPFNPRVYTEKGLYFGKIEIYERLFQYILKLSLIHI